MKQKLKLIELFSGIGAQKRGIDNTGLYDLDVVATSDVDKEAIVEYAAIHHHLTYDMIKNYPDYPSEDEMVKELTDKNIGLDEHGKLYDWSKLTVNAKKIEELKRYWLAMKLQKNLGDISRIEQLPTADMWFYSFCCFVPGTKVLTIDGEKAIEDIKVGDQVMTHLGCYKTVTETMERRYQNSLVIVTTEIGDPIYCTKEHPFYVRKMEDGTLGEPDWVRASDLTENHYVATPLEAVGCEEVVDDRYANYLIEFGYIWSPIKLSSKKYYGRVFNLEVEEDHSYIVHNVAVHNCQDISVAGKQKGLVSTCQDCGHEFNPMHLPLDKRNCCPNCGSTNLKGSRSGLLKEVERLLVKAVNTDTQPKFLCLENVKNLVGKGFKADFDAWLQTLDDLGYNTYWQVLNAKHTGVPQSRERVFAFSIRKDVDTGSFEFPKPFDTGVRLKDILEKKVDERFYINTDRATNLINQLIQKGQLDGTRKCCDMTIKDPGVIETSNAIIARYDAGIINFAKSDCAVAEPADAPQNEMSAILVKNAGDDFVKPLDESVCLKARDWKGWDNYGSTAVVEASKTPEDTHEISQIANLWENQWNSQAGRIYDAEKLSPSLQAGGTTRQPMMVVSNDAKPNESAETVQPEPPIVNGKRYRIRKLTVRECFKLMGFEFADWDNCANVGVSITAGYKAAGNSIVTNCIALLFEHLYKALIDHDFQCTDELYNAKSKE